MQSKCGRCNTDTENDFPRCKVAGGLEWLFAD